MTCINTQNSHRESVSIISCFLEHYQNRRVRQIYEILILHPGVSRKEIAEYLDMSGSAVTWQMERLRADGCVDT